jgi:hypothetical protein
LPAKKPALNVASGGQSATFEPNGGTAPKAKELKFEPEYAVEGGVAHTFNGTLFIPTDEEFKRLEKERAARDAAPKLNPVGIAEKLVHRPFPEQWTTKRVKMSAGDLIRLGTANSKGR